MLTCLTLENFKCFRKQHLTLAPLTILAGLNGTGKSSAIQSLLLLRQSLLSHRLQQGQLNIGGPLADLGTYEDLLFEGAEEDSIRIGITSTASLLEDKSVDAEFLFPSVSDPVLLERAAKINQKNLNQLASVTSDIELFYDRVEPVEWFGFQYLNAERHGPRKYLPMARAGGGRFDLGTKGEYVLDVLLALQDTIKLSDGDPRYIRADSARLRDQLSSWLGEISPGAIIDVQAVPKADLLVGAFTFGAPNKLRSRPYRATNVGFGLSYILPVLVGLLAAQRGGLLIIENPEAHLHPQGQTRIGQLCAFAASAGVQVIIETHSDHFLDGVRIAVREGSAKSSDIAIHYFARKAGEIQVSSPVLDAQGRLSEWPPGFFDQHRRNTSQLIKPV